MTVTVTFEPSVFLSDSKTVAGPSSCFGRKRILPSKALADPNKSLWALSSLHRSFLLSISGLKDTWYWYTFCSTNLIGIKLQLREVGFPAVPFSPVWVVATSSLTLIWAICDTGTSGLCC